jgi:galacturan 1,4-alpha-galacturonidase
MADLALFPSKFPIFTIRVAPQTCSWILITLSTMTVINFVHSVLLNFILSACIVVAVSSGGKELTHTVKRFPSISNLLGTCTLTSSGGDDGPAFAAAILSDQCSTVNVPSGTTLSIASPLNTTAAYNKNISLGGTLSFTNDTVSPYTYLTAYESTYMELSYFRRTGSNIHSNSLTKMP